MSYSEPPVEPAEPYKRPSAAPGSGPTPTNDEKNLAMLAHLTGGLGAVLSGFLGPLGPAIIWVIKKDESAFVAEQAREALNFQITLLIIYAVATVLALVTCGIGFLLIIVPWVLALIFCIISSLAVSKGESYRYPFNIRLIT